MSVLKYVLTIYAVIQSIFIIMWCIGLLHWEIFIIFIPTWVLLLIINILPISLCIQILIWLYKSWKKQ